MLQALVDQLSRGCCFFWFTVAALLWFPSARSWASSSCSSSSPEWQITPEFGSINILTHLPGFSGPLPFQMETGYIPVNEEDGAQMFYYFIKSEGDPVKDPLMLWLTGGPGCSALSGIVFEIGPFTFDIDDYNGSLPTLKYRDNSWTKESNIIFVDTPIGTGFSYSLKSRDNGDLKTAKETTIFLKKWFANHPQFSSNAFYVGGDSYAGIYLPIIVQEIAMGNQVKQDNMNINLKGYLVGNPITNEYYDKGALVPYVHGMGLISDELYEKTKELCGGEYAYPKNVACARSIELVNQCISGTNRAHITEPICEFFSPNLLKLVGSSQSVDNILKNEHCRLDCRDYILSYIWADNTSVRKALEIHKGSIRSWCRCSSTLNYTQDVLNSVPYHFNLTNEGYRALIYSGDHDRMVPHIGTQAWIKLFNFELVDDWRPWWIDDQVGGFTRTYSNNLTFATVKGGGHTAPEYRPKECLTMFKRWIRGCTL